MLLRMTLMTVIITNTRTAKWVVLSYNISLFLVLNQAQFLVCGIHLNTETLRVFVKCSGEYAPLFRWDFGEELHCKAQSKYIYCIGVKMCLFEENLSVIFYLENFKEKSESFVGAYWFCGDFLALHFPEKQDGTWKLEKLRWILFSWRGGEYSSVSKSVHIQKNMVIKHIKLEAKLMTFTHLN